MGWKSLCFLNRRRSLPGLVLTLVLAAVPCYSKEAPPIAPRIQLVWADPCRLLRFGFETMTDEVESIFRQVGVDVTWKLRASAAPDPLEILIFVKPTPPKRWTTGPRAMGCVMRAGPIDRRVVFVFFNNIPRTLGFTIEDQSLPTASEIVTLANAVGRVVAHEIVHSFAPDQPHAELGLMRRSYTHTFFLKRQARWTDVCASAFLSGLRAAAGSKMALLDSSSLATDGDHRGRPK